MAGVDDGTCWNCKHYAENHDYAMGSCMRITDEGRDVYLDMHIEPVEQALNVERIWLNVVHDFGCKLYEYSPKSNPRGLPHPPSILEKTWHGNW